MRFRWASASLSDADPHGGGSAATRRLLIVPIVAAHGALLAMVALSPAPSGRVAETRSIALFDVAAPAAAAVPPTLPAEPVARPAQPEELVFELPVADIATPQSIIPSPPIVASAVPGLGADGAPCDLAGAVLHVLRSDPASLQAIDAVPAADRSVANAIMLWDGGWTRDARLDPVRTRIGDAIAAARSECRDAPQGGPSLIALPGGERTTMLVLGSGRWRWADLIAAETAATSTISTGTISGREAAHGAAPSNRRVHS